jgi:hypothetical protein
MSKLPKLDTEWKDLKARINTKKKKIEKNIKKKVDYNKFNLIVIPFLKVVFVYGILINFSVFILLGHVFNFYSWIAYGFLYYLISEELPILIMRCKKST